MAPITEVRIGDTKHSHSTTLSKYPRIVCLPLITEIHEQIHLGEMNQAERDLISLGFGSAFTLEQHKSLLPINRSFRITEAKGKLNARLKKILPPTMPLQFELTEIGANPELLAIGLIDQHQGFAPLGSRGTGVRRLMNVMGALLGLEPEKGHVIVLYDEPETSLHSDAQHMLRRLLENLATRPEIQVVYTTHSPSMINTLRPQSIRVLERERIGEKAVSRFVNNAFQENYSRVRSSLGITPGDSLLYAPITIVVEGATEVRCVPLVLSKLAEAKIVDASLLDLLLPQTHILDGEGDNFERMCRLSKSQHACPVLFLDGDKNNQIPKVREKHPDVPIITLTDGTEFEEIVPRAKYIEAVANLVGDTSGSMTEAGYAAWETSFKPKHPIMFSKLVERWLQDQFGKSVPKHGVMEKAVEITDAGEILAESFQKLVQAMKAVSDSM